MTVNSNRNDDFSYRMRHPCMHTLDRLLVLWAYSFDPRHVSYRNYSNYRNYRHSERGFVTVTYYRHFYRHFYRHSFHPLFERDFVFGWNAVVTMSDKPHYFIICWSSYSILWLYGETIVTVKSINVLTFEVELMRQKDLKII